MNHESSCWLVLTLFCSYLNLLVVKQIQCLLYKQSECKMEIISSDVIWSDIIYCFYCLAERIQKVKVFRAKLVNFYVFGLIIISVNSDLLNNLNCNHLVALVSSLYKFVPILFQLRAAAALQSRINQAQAHSRAAAALIHAAAASAQPALAAAAYESRSKVVSSPLPVIQASRADLAGHLFYQQQSPSHRRTPQTHLPPPSAPSSAPSSIIQLSAGKKKHWLDTP